MFNRKDYKAIADMAVKHTIEHASDTGAELVKSDFVNDMADYFAGDNPLFDRERFLTACDTSAICATCDADSDDCATCYADTDDEQKALRQTTVTRQVCSCCTTEIKDGDAILFAGSLKLCSVCVGRIGKADAYADIGGKVNIVVGMCPSCERIQKDNYPIRFSILPIKVKPGQLTIEVPAYCEGCGFSWHAVYTLTEIIER